jgi:hypothetical protein
LIETCDATWFGFVGDVVIRIQSAEQMTMLMRAVNPRWYE